jgi:hypothetical protein
MASYLFYVSGSLEWIDYHLISRQMRHEDLGIDKRTEFNATEYNIETAGFPSALDSEG